MAWVVAMSLFLLFGGVVPLALFYATHWSAEICVGTGQAMLLAMVVAKHGSLRRMVSRLLHVARLGRAPGSGASETSVASGEVKR